MAYKLKYYVNDEGSCGGTTCYSLSAWENNEEFNQIIKNIIESNKNSLIRHDKPEEMCYELHPWKILFWFKSSSLARQSLAPLKELEPSSTGKETIDLNCIPKTLLDKYLE
jgi:hypothetical protein